MRKKKILLKDLLVGVPVISSHGDLAVPIHSLSYDSRELKNKGLFVAVNGLTQDGNFFIPDAVKRGACAVVSEKNIFENTSIPAWVTVEDSRKALAILSDNYYDHPSKKMHLIGITGTNGKTTITYLIDSVLSKAHINAGVIGTINCRYAGMTKVSNHTTPESLDLQRIFFDMNRKKVDCAIMEVSSHSLSLDRVSACDFEIGLFTNLSQDHLDFHKDQEDYFKAKLKLFTQCKIKTAIVNRDDPYGVRILKKTGAEKLTYGITSKADVFAADIKTHADRLTFSVKTPGGSFFVKSNLLGMYNVYNILAAVAVGTAKKIDLPAIKSGIENVRCVPGRFEPVNMGQDFLVAVDYAHTDDALQNVLTMVRGISSARIITVFGCGGNRDKGKRRLMGKVAAKNSDYLVVTSDNPRMERPADISNEIEKGIKEVGLNQDKYIMIEDRKEAIFHAISWARKNDVVLIAGKGHEDYQIIGTKKNHFDDREVASQALKYRLKLVTQSNSLQ